MDNGNQPAYPASASKSGINREVITVEQVGLTKRELIAAMAMQGLLASWDRTSMPSRISLDLVAKSSVECADALLSELGK